MKELFGYEAANYRGRWHPLHHGAGDLIGIRSPLTANSDQNLIGAILNSFQGQSRYHVYQNTLLIVGHLGVFLGAEKGPQQRVQTRLDRSEVIRIHKGLLQVTECGGTKGPIL